MNSSPETLCVVKSDGAQRIITPGIKCHLFMKVARRSVASRTDESAALNQQLDVADADIALVNKWLDEAQGMFQRHLIRGVWCACIIRYVLDADSAAAVENLRAELA